MKYGLSNARIEGLNNKIKLVIHRSYGFGNTDNQIVMIRLVCSDAGRNLRPVLITDLRKSAKDDNLNFSSLYT